MDFIIRKGELNDCASILELIHELAVFTNRETPSITIYDLIRDGFSTNKLFSTYVAVNNNLVIGFIMFYKTYSICGKSMIIEDVFINKEFIHNGIGLSLFSKVIAFTNKNKINRIELGLLEKYKKLAELYNRTGAKIIWDAHIYTISENNILKFGNLDIDFNEHKTRNTLVIRKGKMQDAQEIITFFEDLSTFKKSECQVGIYDIINDGFSDNNYFHVLVAEINDELVGMLIYYDSYSTEYGKSINLENFYVKPEFRNLGIGKMLYLKLFNHAANNKVKQIAQGIYDWDKNNIKHILKYGGNKVLGKRIVQIDYHVLHDFINKP